MFQVSNRAVSVTPEVRTALERLFVRRGRGMMVLGIVAAPVFVAVTHLMGTARLWSDAMNLCVAALLAAGLALTRLAVVQRHMAELCLLLASIFAAVRALAGIWHGDVTATAIFIVVFAILVAATLPWGLWSQLGLACVLGAAVAFNWHMVTGWFGPESGRAAANLLLGLGGSVILAAETRRHQTRRLADEAALARLNAELEQRVDERTAQLASTTRALEAEAQERRQTEAELRESERRLQAVLDHADVAIYLRDLDGRYLLVNRYWLRLAGLTAEEVIGRTIDEIMPADVAATLRAHDAEVLRAPYSQQFEETIPQLDGWHTFVSVRFAWLGPDGRPAGIWGLATDITELKRAEQAALQHQADLAHVLRLGTIGEINAGLAHEINQPLGAIANYAQGCVRRLRDGVMDAKALLPVIEQIGAEALRASEIIRRLRDLVRKDASRQEPADLNHLVRESVRLIEPEARARHVALQLELAPTLPAVTCNDIQIEQVLLNLLLNGVEAIDVAGNGQRTLSVRTALAGDAAEVAVCDSGVGLPEPPADVFAPFYTTKASGLGMGLSISRSIIEAHGGRLWGTRNPELGATFRFTLPV